MTAKTRDERFAKLEADMQELTKNGDFEGAHCDADALLCDMIELLGKNSKYKARIARFLEDYHNVGKWYA